MRFLPAPLTCFASRRDEFAEPSWSSFSSVPVRHLLGYLIEPAGMRKTRAARPRICLAGAGPWATATSADHTGAVSFEIMCLYRVFALPPCPGLIRGSTW